MFEDPAQQWRELTAHYAAMWDEELLNLAREYNDLTEMAKQVLRDEMKKRGLGDPTAPRPNAAAIRLAEAAASVEGAIPTDISSPGECARLTQRYRDLCNEDLLDLAESYTDITPSAKKILSDEMRRRGLDQQITAARIEDPDQPDALNRAEAAMRAALQARRHERFGDHPREYTWKVPLMDCESRDETMQRLTMLMREGIQCWFMDPSGVLSDPTVSRLDYRIFVPADQLEEAQRVIAQPIPQDVIDESKMEIPEFVMPRCARCGNKEPVLIGAEAANHWQCESCGNEWTESVEETNPA